MSWHCALCYDRRFLPQCQKEIYDKTVRPLEPPLYIYWIERNATVIKYWESIAIATRVLSTSITPMMENCLIAINVTKGFSKVPKKFTLLPFRVSHMNWVGPRNNFSAK